MKLSNIALLLELFDLRDKMPPSCIIECKTLCAENPPLHCFPKSATHYIVVIDCSTREKKQGEEAVYFAQFGVDVKGGMRIGACGQ